MSSTAALSLPSGSVTVGVRVLDRLGGYSEYSTTLQLSAAAGNLSEAGFLLSYSALSQSAALQGDAVTVVAAAASVLSTAMASSLPAASLLLLKDTLMMDVLSWSAALPDDYISAPLALFVSDPASTSLQAVEYALTFVAALSAGDAMAGSVNQLQAVVRILDGVIGVIAAGQSGGSGSGRRLLQTQQLDLNGLNSELFASLNSLALDISSQLMLVQGDSLPVSAQQLSGLVRRGVLGNDSLTLSVAGSSLTVPAVARLRRRRLRVRRGPVRHAGCGLRVPRAERAGQRRALRGRLRRSQLPLAARPAHRHQHAGQLPAALRLQLQRHAGRRLRPGAGRQLPQHGRPSDRARLLAAVPALERDGLRRCRSGDGLPRPEQHEPHRPLPRVAAGRAVAVHGQ